MSLSSNSITAASYETGTSDALVFRATAELLTRGRSPYDPVAQAEIIRDHHLGGVSPPYTLPFLYPPNALPLFTLYGVGSPRVGYVLFTTTITLILLTGLYALMASLGYAQGERLLAVMGVSVGGATLFNAQLGQTGALAAALGMLYVANYSRAPGWAGVCLGLLAFKPQYAVFLAAWPLACRHVRVLGFAAATLTGCALASGAAFGFGRFGELAHALRTPNWTAPEMVNWFALIPHVGGALPSSSFAMGVALVAFAALLAVCRHRLVRGGDLLDGVGLSAAVAVIASPNTHPYDLGLWVLPLLALVRRRPWRHPGALIALASVAVHPFIRPDRRFVLALASVILVALTLLRTSPMVTPESR